MLETFFRPAAFADPLPETDAKRLYPRYRFQMLASIFVGYAAFYIVRSNFSFAKPYLIDGLGLTKGQVGLIASALAASYGISKFVMGNVSDRSNPRVFMACGLMLSGLVNIFFGYVHALWMLALLWFANGWFQGMGWGPCARIMTHWFSDRERGTKMAIWNTAHNVGGALTAPLSTLALATLPATMAITTYSPWSPIFFVPGYLAIVVGVGLLIFLRDTPQSVGLPPIEEYANDYPHTGVEDRERELSAREILVGYVLNSRPLWILALANLAVYVVRYGVLNWAPTYLPEVKHYVASGSRWQSFIFEMAGIPGMLVSGWISDRFFSGRRAPISVVFMLIVTFGVLVYWLNPPGHPVIDSVSLFVIGFAIYGPVMLIGVAAIDCVPKKAAGTAAGFTGLFGYIGTVGAELGVGAIVERWGWDAGFSLIIACTGISSALLALLWNAHDRSRDTNA